MIGIFRPRCPLCNQRMKEMRFGHLPYGDQVRDFISHYTPKLKHIEQAWTCTACDALFPVSFGSDMTADPGGYLDDTQTANCLICNLEGYLQILCMSVESGGIVFQAIDELHAGDDFGDER